MHCSKQQIQMSNKLIRTYVLSLTSKICKGIETLRAAFTAHREEAVGLDYTNHFSPPRMQMPIVLTLGFKHSRQILARSSRSHLPSPDEQKARLLHALTLPIQP